MDVCASRTRLWFRFLAILSLVFVQTSAFAQSEQSPAGIVRAVLSAPGEELSYERAKLTFDRIIAPELDQVGAIAEIDLLATAAKRIAAVGNDIDKLKAVRQVIYVAGTWNGSRPFVYDHADPYGEDLHNKLLATYIDTRRGNCVSMPILQLIVAERLGLNVSLSTAPLHVFMRYTSPTNGRSLAIEATSGGHPARETWYHEQLGVTDAQVKSGIYLGVLTKRESIAGMASTVTEWLMSQGRQAEAIEVADVLLEYYPTDVHAVLSRGTAHGELFRTEFVEHFPTPAAIPMGLQSRYRMLAAQNAAAFRQAEAWGWRPPQQ